MRLSEAQKSLPPFSICQEQSFDEETTVTYTSKNLKKQAIKSAHVKPQYIEGIIYTYFSFYIPNL